MDDFLQWFHRISWQPIVSQVLILLGVFLGGWVSPWIGNRLANRKDKRLLKIRLVELTSKYFAYKKRYLRLINASAITISKYNALIKSVDMKSDTVNIYEQRLCTSLEEMIMRDKNLENEMITNMINIRSKVFGLTVEIQMLYSDNKYDEIIDVLERRMTGLGENLLYSDWAAMDSIEFENHTKKLNVLHFEKKREIDAIASEIRHSIIYTLN